VVEYFQYIVDHLDSLVKLVAYFIVPSSVLISFFKKMYLNYKYRAPKRAVKLIMYLTKYSRYLNDIDREHINMRINDEIMRDAAKIPSAFNRKELVYITSKIEKRPYINQIYKLQSYIEKKDGFFYIKIDRYDFSWILTWVISFLVGVLFFIFILLGVTSIFEGKSTYVNMTFLSMAVFLELVGLWMFSTFPTRKTIEKINIELAKIKVPD